MRESKDITRVQTDSDPGEIDHPEKSFNALSTFSLAVSLMATWEGLCSTFGSGLMSGGSVSLLYGFIASFIGNLSTVMSLSEPASIWYTGWITLLGWVALTASAPFASANLIQVLVTLSHPEYEPERWHGYLIYVTLILMACFMNILGGRVLTVLENVIMCLHVGFFFAILIAVAALPRERNTAEFVFTFFQNRTGWDNDAIAWCLGMLTSAYIMIGYDSATHVSEEMRNPRTGVPQAMICSLVVNGVMGFAVLIAILFGMTDMEGALGSKTGFPIIHIFLTITRGNLVAATAMTSTIIISASLATVGLIASTSRILWALARDGAPAFSGPLSRLHSKTSIPLNAVITVTVILVLLGLLNIASTTAFTAILSLTVVALSLSYIIPVIAMLYRRIFTPEQLQWGPWRMSASVGLIVNIISICYIVFLTIFLVLPPVRPVHAGNMNYAGVLLGAVLLLTTIDWVLRGRKTYTGPIDVWNEK
ncbi:hypothetical protein DL765_006606 [Monosporascus sp. GIB2]|nr:hypothetical protein DL765_006606 [Monosporascus sp. GIB2]